MVLHRERHPGWEYRLWTDTENRELVWEHYPWLLDLYDGLPENIMRADMARILYMHQFGGAPGILGHSVTASARMCACLQGCLMALRPRVQPIPAAFNRILHCRTLC